MSPAHPSVKCFFFWAVKQLVDVRPYIWGWLCLKEPWFRRFRQSFRSRRNIENCCENNLRGLSSAGKIYQARTLCLNSTQHCPAKADFTASKERQQWNGSCPSAKTMALKSGMTLTYWIVHNRHTTIKIPQPRGFSAPRWNVLPAVSLPRKVDGAPSRPSILHFSHQNRWVFVATLYQVKNCRVIFLLNRLIF